VARLYPQALGSLFVSSYDLQGYGGDIQPRLHAGLISYSQNQGQSNVTADGRSACLSWCQAPIWGLRPDVYYRHEILGLMSDAVSDERTGLRFTIAAGPRQRSHSWVRVLRDS
jgi:hypothetical protein